MGRLLAQCSRVLCFRLLQDYSEGADLACGLIWGLTGEGSTSKFTWLLAAFSSLTPVGWGQQFWQFLARWASPTSLISSKPAKEAPPHKTDITVLCDIIMYMQVHASHRVCRGCGALLELPTTAYLFFSLILLPYIGLKQGTGNPSKNPCPYLPGLSNETLESRDGIEECSGGKPLVALERNPN